MSTTVMTVVLRPSTKRPVAQRSDSSLYTYQRQTKRQNTKPRQPHAQHQSRLFCLPLELRLAIYDFALPSSALSALLTARDAEDIEIESAIEPAFLQTCRLAREEGLAQFYRHNNFLLPRRPSLDYQHPLTLSMNPAFMQRKSKRPGLSSKWMYALSAEQIANISTIVFAQLGRGMYKDQASQWRRDASACFRVSFLHGRRARAAGGKGFKVEYIPIDETGLSERYAERLLKALKTRMETLVGEMGATEWTREDIWDLAYLL